MRAGQIYRAVVIGMFLCLGPWLTGSADARPFRGSAKWSVLLCRFTDGGAVPRTTQ